MKVWVVEQRWAIDTIVGYLDMMHYLASSKEKALEWIRAQDLTCYNADGPFWWAVYAQEIDGDSCGELAIYDMKGNVAENQPPWEPVE